MSQTIENQSNDNTNIEHVMSYLHCKQCFAEKPVEQSMKQFSHLEVGLTEAGILVRCVRHDSKVAHVKIEGGAELI